MQLKIEALENKLEIQAEKLSTQQISLESNQLKLLDIAEGIQETPDKPTKMSHKIYQKMSQSQELQRLEMHWQAKLEKSANTWSLQT